MARGRSAGEARECRALLLRRVVTGDADLILAWFTLEAGVISTLARAARKSSKRFGGALEPLQTARLVVNARAGELWTLREALIETPRTRLMTELERMDAAGSALGWVRKVVPAHTPEPTLWHATEALLDRLDGQLSRSADCELAEFGFVLLTELGWALELERCVKSGKACEPGRAAFVDPRAGGLVSRAYGGGPIRLPGDSRERMVRAGAGERDVLTDGDATVALGLIRTTLAAHAG